MSRLLAFVLVFITHLSVASVMYGQTAVDLSGLRNEKTTKAEDKYLAFIPGRVQGNYGHKAEAAVFAVGTYSALASTIACGSLWWYNDYKYRNSNHDRAIYGANAGSFRTATIISGGVLALFYATNYLDARIVSKRENRKVQAVVSPDLFPNEGYGLSLALRF